jgi:hypothetical protein
VAAQKIVLRITKGVVTAEAIKPITFLSDEMAARSIMGSGFGDKSKKSARLNRGERRADSRAYGTGTGRCKP